MKVKILFAAHAICAAQIIFATILDVAKRNLTSLETPKPIEISAIPVAATIMLFCTLMTAIEVKKRQFNGSGEVMPRWMASTMSNLTFVAIFACLTGMILKEF